jgi:hypothetical protein
MKVRIGPVDYAITAEDIEDPEYGENYGSFHPGDGIEICPEQDPGAMALTVMHEIVHAMWATYKLPEMIDEETAAARLEGPLLAFLRDNPELIRLLVAAAAGTPLPL